MAKYGPIFAAAFAPPESDGSFNNALEAAVAAGPITEALGLVLGSAGQGQFDSGIDLTIDRVFSDKGRLPGAFTRPLSTFLALEASTFNFTFDLCGNRASGAPTVGGDLTPVTGIDAILLSAYLRGAAGTVGGNSLSWDYKPGLSGDVGDPMCGYIWAQGERMKFLGARSSLSIPQTPQEVGTCTASINVGEILELVEQVVADPSTYFDYGLQASVGAANVVSVNNTWGLTRGWSDCTLNVEASIDDIPDSNSSTGVVKEPSGLDITCDMTIYKDDGDPDFEATQLQANSAGVLTELSWKVGLDRNAALPAGGNQEGIGYEVSFPTPELQSEQPAPQGVSSASTISVIGRSTSAGEEFVLSFV